MIIIMSSAKNDAPIAGKQRVHATASPSKGKGCCNGRHQLVPKGHNIKNTVLARSLTNLDRQLTSEKTLPYLPSSGFTWSNSRARKFFAPASSYNMLEIVVQRVVQTSVTVTLCATCCAVNKLPVELGPGLFEFLPVTRCYQFSQTRRG